MIMTEEEDALKNVIYLIVMKAIDSRLDIKLPTVHIALVSHALNVSKEQIAFLTSVLNVKAISTLISQDVLRLVHNNSMIMVTFVLDVELTV